jgi:hypothetical protein
MTTGATLYIRLPDETLQDFIVRIKAAGRLPELVEEPQHRPARLRRSTGRPVGRPRKSQEP